MKLIKLETHPGRTGILSVIEDPPFKIKRVFWIYDVEPGEYRGGHAHKKCHQLLVAIHGAVLARVGCSGDFVLDCPDLGLYVPPLNIVQMKFLDEGAVLMVLASDRFDPNDYIYE